MIFHVARAGEVIGEFNESTFQEKIFVGEIRPEDHYWTEGLGDWRPVSQYRIAAKTVRMKAVPPPAPSNLEKRPASQQVLPSVDKLCANCAYLGPPRNVTKGSFVIEIMLWLCLLLPGIVYSVWRRSSRYAACPKCGRASLIPADSLVAQRFLEQK